MECLTCGMHFNKNSIEVCDNDCGTIICDKGHEQYFDKNENKYVQGHNPSCGDDS